MYSTLCTNTYDFSTTPTSNYPLIHYDVTHYDLPGGSRPHAGHTAQQHHIVPSAEAKYFIKSLLAVAKLLSSSHPTNTPKIHSRVPAPKKLIPNFTSNNHRNFKVAFGQQQRSPTRTIPFKKTTQNGNLLSDGGQPGHWPGIRAPTRCKTIKHHYRRRPLQIRRHLGTRKPEQQLKHPYHRMRCQLPRFSLQYRVSRRRDPHQNRC